MIKIKTEYILRGISKNDKRAVIFTDVRQPDGSVRYEAVKGFIPYFYVPANSRIPEGEPRILKIERGFKSIYGEDVVKVYTRLPYDVPGVRDNFYKHYEADVLYDWRWRIDRGYVEKENVKFFLDIEVAMGSRFVRDNYSFPITSMVCYDTASNKYTVFTWRGDIKGDKQVLKRKKRVLDREKNGSIIKDQEFEDEYVVYKFSNEQAMMAAFVNHFKHVDPDIVTAWNAGFDYPYIIQRMQKLNVDFSDMSPLKQVFIDKWSGEARIKGRYVFDLLAAYRKLNIGQLESFKLDDVGAFEFGVKKIKFDMTYIDLWKKDLDKLIEYNIADVELCVELDKKKGVLDFYEGVSNFTGVPFDCTLQNSRTLDFYFLKHAHEEGIVLPSVDRSVNATPFEGAIVMDPVKGLHENVMGLDLRSVSGDTHVYVKCGSGFRHFRIDDFFKYVFSSDKNIQRLVSGYYKVASSDDNGNVGWYDITNVIKHDNDKNMKEIITESGRSIKLTGDHSVFKCESGKMNCVSADDLCISDRLYTLKKINIPQRSFNNKNVNNKLFEFFGLYLAEGWSSKTSVNIEINDYDLLKSHCDNLISLGYYCKLSVRERNVDRVGGKRIVNSYVLRITSQYSVSNRKSVKSNLWIIEFLKSFGVNAREKIIPNRIICSSVDKLKSFLNGYWLGDGYVSGARNGVYGVQTYSKNILNSIIPIFIKLGYDYTIRDISNGGYVITYFDGSSNRKSGNLMINFSDISLKLVNKIRAKYNNIIGGNRKRITSSKLFETIPTFYEWVLDDINSCYNDNIGTEKIESISDCGVDSYVYDLSVKGTERFFAGNGNILVHNSLYPSIILSGNMSLETISEDGDVKFGNGVSFDSRKEGFITKHVQAFLDRRKKIKAEMLEELEKNGKTQLYHKLNKEQTVTKFITNCFSPDTDVLTPEGIKNIKDFKVGDDVYSVNPKTLKTEVKKVTRTYEYDYEGDMYHIKSSRSDFLITPNHKMFMGGGNAGNKCMKYRDVYAENLFDDYVDNTFAPFRGIDGGVDDEYITIGRWVDDDAEVAIKPLVYGRKFLNMVSNDGIDIDLKLCMNHKSIFDGSSYYVCKYKDIKNYIDYFYSIECDIIVRVSRFQNYVPYRFRTSDFFELVGYFVSEGSTYKSKGVYYGDKYAGVSSRVTIAQNKLDMPIIEDLVKRMGIIYSVFTNERGVLYLGFSSEILYDIFISEFGVGAKNKNIPSWVYKYDRKYLQILLDALWFGDGDKKFSHCGRYSTISKKLAGDVVRLCLHLGRGARIYYEKYDYGAGIIYRVNCNRVHKNGHCIGSTKQNINDIYSKVDYDGKVYCIEVEDNHTLYAGRNGKFQAIKNSIYGILGFASSRYFRQEIGETITYVGREINLHTQQVCKDNGATVLYGDTDSVYVKFDEDFSMDELVSRMYELQNIINKSYNDFADRFNIKKHYFDIKAESILERALFVKKKRYAGKVCFDEGVFLEGDKKYTKIMGFQNRRSDTPKFTKGFQKEVLNMILDGKGKDELFSYIRNAVDNFENLEIDDIAIPKNFTKPFDEYLGGSANSVFINAAKWCNDKFDFMDIGGGSKVMFLYLKRPSIPGGICFNRGEYFKVNSDDIKIDFEKMLERAIYMPIKTIIEAMGWTEDELKTGELQTYLSEWF